jgi:hypothetical protein
MAPWRPGGSKISSAVTFSHLLYMSVASSTATGTLEDILRVSDRNNALLDVTGILIVRDGRYVQLLEGARSNVRTLYETISKDRRHYNVREVLSFESSTRLFPQWRMGRVPESPLTARMFDSVKATLARTALDGSDPRESTLAILHEFSHDSSAG